MCVLFCILTGLHLVVRVTRSYYGSSCGGSAGPSSIKHRMSHRYIMRHTPQPHALRHMVNICCLHQTLRHNHSCCSSRSLTNIRYFTFCSFPALLDYFNGFTPAKQNTNHMHILMKRRARYLVRRTVVLINKQRLKAGALSGRKTEAWIWLSNSVNEKMSLCIKGALRGFCVTCDFTSSSTNLTVMNKMHL